MDAPHMEDIQTMLEDEAFVRYIALLDKINDLLELCEMKTDDPEQ